MYIPLPYTFMGRKNFDNCINFKTSLWFSQNLIRYFCDFPPETLQTATYVRIHFGGCIHSNDEIWIRLHKVLKSWFHVARVLAEKETILLKER